MAMDGLNLRERGLLSTFGRNKSRKLVGRRKELAHSLLPKIQVHLPASGGVKYSEEEVAGLFAGRDELWLELGFGGGEHLAARAMQSPDVSFVGCEPFFDGVSRLLEHVEDEQIDNVQVFCDDARLLMQALPDDSLTKMFILFPDPWPKIRHHKRRIISPQTLDLLARVMVNGGELRLATDHVEYAEWMLEHMQADERFTWLAKSKADWQTPPEGWVTTRYQEKAAKQGRAPNFFNFILSK